MNNEELITVYKDGCRASFESIEGIPAASADLAMEYLRLPEPEALRHVFNAGLTRAAEIARSMDGNEANGYYGQACHEVAGACETEVGKL